MAWRDTLTLLGVLGSPIGVTGALLTVVPQLPGGKDWNAGGYR